MRATSPFPLQDFGFSLIDYLERRLRFAQVQPLWLGGEPGSPGSVAPPGGYIGLLPQNRVQYDDVEAEYASGGSTLMDNLAHDRYRLTSYINQLASYEDSGGSICTIGEVSAGSLPSYGSGAAIVGFSPGSPPGVTTVQDAIQRLWNELNGDVTSFYTWHTFMFSLEGTITTGEKELRLYVPGAMTISEVFTAVNTAPVGDSIIVDVDLNGTSIFNVTPANRPEIADGAYTDTSGAPDTTALVKNDYLTFEVVQVGSTTAGSYLTVHVRCKQYLQVD